MYPTLYHAFYDIFGIDWPWMKLLNSFGFFVAIAFVVASYLLSSELKRKGEQGLLGVEKRKLIIGKPVSWMDVGVNALIGFFFGWKIIYLLSNAGELFGGDVLPQEHIFSLQGYPLIGFVMAVAFAAWKYYEYHKQKLDEPIEKVVDFHKYEYTGTITLIAALWGIIGAKLFHLFENPTEFFAFFTDPTLQGFLSGLTIYGGLIIGGLAVWVFARKKKIPAIHLLDSSAPPLILAYGVGRIGCQVSGDGDWGIPNAAAKPDWLTWLPDWLWSYNYPNNVNGISGPRPEGYTGKLITESDPWPFFEGYGTYLDPGVFPTPVYETVMTIIIFSILWYLRKRLNIAGMIFAIYLFLAGIERILIEQIRVNNKVFGLQITQAEIISLVFIVSGLVMAYFLWKRKHKINEDPPQEATNSGPA